MAAGGGAMMGFQMGGPLGAAIGAVAGAGIGLGEMLSGDISPRQKVKNQIKSVYGLTVNNSFADQVVQMSQQYGGNISMTIKSQQVRQLISLYAESTGQKSSLFLTSPLSANLVSVNGSLQQAATHHDGTGYMFGSAAGLGTYGGGGQLIPTGNPYQAGSNASGPAMGSNPIIQLSVNGQSAADLMEARATTAILSGYNRIDSMNTLADPGSMPYV
jgi:hypothetical protein